jgi:hypothetical protein
LVHLSQSSDPRSKSKNQPIEQIKTRCMKYKQQKSFSWLGFMASSRLMKTAVCSMCLWHSDRHFDKRNSTLFRRLNCQWIVGLIVLSQQWHPIFPCQYTNNYWLQTKLTLTYYSLIRQLLLIRCQIEFVFENGSRNHFIWRDHPTFFIY